MFSKLFSSKWHAVSFAEIKGLVYKLDGLVELDLRLDPIEEGVYPGVNIRVAAGARQAPRYHSHQAVFSNEGATGITLQK